jgi:hypothetical protein
MLVILIAQYIDNIAIIYHEQYLSNEYIIINALTCYDTIYLGLKPYPYVDYLIHPIPRKPNV